MVDPIVVRNIRDTHVLEDKPNATPSHRARLVLWNEASKRRQAFMFWGKPFPAGSRIISAKLIVYNANAWTGTVTLRAARITEKWNTARTTWKNRPAVAPNDKTATRSNAAKNTPWEIDLTEFIQSASSGAEWFGIRLEAQGTSQFKLLHSANSPDSDYRPVVEITWSDAPEAPEELAPDGGRAVGTNKPTLTFDFTDVAGDTDLNSIQVKIGSVDDITQATWDSGWRTAIAPELDLVTTNYPGIPNGGTVYWWVRVRDGAGLESAWSDSGEMRYVPKGTINLTQPGPAPGNYVEDLTPPITWSYSGGTQTAFQVILTTPDTPNQWVWTTGKLAGNDTAVTIPRKKLKFKVANYRIIVRVWDDVVREKVDNSPIWAAITRDFTVQFDPTVDPVQNLAMSRADPYPWADLTWTRNTVPDEFSILRNGEVIDAHVDSTDLIQPGGGFKYRDRTAAPRVNHTWEIVAHINNRSSKSNPTISGSTRPNLTWLMWEDSSNPICIATSGRPGPVVEANSSTIETVHEPLEGTPVLITQSVRGFDGSVAGVLATGLAQGLTGEEMRDRFKRFKKQKGRTAILYMVDETLKIIPYNMNYRPRSRNGEVLYDVTFDFFEEVE